MDSLSPTPAAQENDFVHVQGVVGQAFVEP